MTPEIIDSHCHLDFEYDQSVEDMVRDAKEAGVTHIIAITAEPASLKLVPEIVKRFDNLFHSSGIHPHDAKNLDDECFETVKQMAALDRCVAVGEIGLDFYYDHSPHEIQIEALRKQLDLAVEIGKPVIIHTRNANEATATELTAYAKKWQAAHGEKSPGVIHCFTGSAELAKICLDLNFYISFSGIITFKNAKDLREVVQQVVPMNRILVETDSPYLTPVPHRGKKNHPMYTTFVLEKLAELKGVTIQIMAETTRRNTIDLFSLNL